MLVGQKLKYVNLDRFEKAQKLSDSLLLLELSRVFYPVKHSSGNGVPLRSEVKESDFKTLFLDIGLVSTSLDVNSSTLRHSDDLTCVNNGAIAEQFIGQHLLYSRESYEKSELFYWNRQQKSSQSELDYLLSQNGQVIPVEVKAGKTGTLKSLQLFVSDKKLNLGLRFNQMPPSLTDVKSKDRKGCTVEFKLLSLPLYMVCQTRRLLSEIQLLSLCRP